MKRWLTISLIAIILVAIVAIAVGFRSGTPVQTARADRAKISEFVDERGKTRLPRVYRVKMPQAGWIQEINLPEGTPVKKDQIVAQISAEDLNTAVAEAQAVVERLDAAIAENDDVAVEASVVIQAKEFVTSMNNTVDAGKARMESSLKRSQFAETNLGRVRQLLQSGARTDDEFDRATLAYWEGQLGYQQDMLVWEALKSIKAATALLPKMVRDYIAHKRLTRAILEKQKAEAEARLRRISIERERSVMRSPIDGIVLKRLVQNAQQLAPSVELLQIGSLDQLQVEADILSQDVGRISVGNQVTVYGPAVAASLDDGVDGIVQQIYPAGFTKLSSLGVEQQRVKIIIEFPPASLQRLKACQIGVDFRVRVRVFTKRKPNALVVPRAALFRSPNGDWQLFAVRNDRAVLQTVDVGLLNDMKAEIVKGLEQGQLVVLAPDSKLQDGTRVSAQVSREP